MLENIWKLIVKVAEKDFQLHFPAGSTVQELEGACIAFLQYLGQAKAEEAAKQKAAQQQEESSKVESLPEQKVE